MKTAKAQGEAGGRCVRSAFTRIPLRMGAALALLLGAGLVLPAHAAALYRCTGNQGETVLTNFPSQYRGCKWLSGSRSAQHRGPAKQDQVGPVPASLVQADSAPARKQAKANPAVIQIKPLPAASAPRVGPLAPAGQDVLPIAKPWPMALMDTIATSLLPELLDSAPQRSAPAAPARSSLAQPARTGSATNASAPKRGAVYKVTRKDGTVEYTNIASRAHGANATMLFTYIITCYACNVHSRVDWNTVALHLDDYGDAIHAAAAKTGVGEALLRAIIHAESGFNPRALSYKGAQGLMQLMPGTASDMGVTDAFDATQNIAGGAKYLAQLLHDFKGNATLAAAAYNAGEGAVRKYNGVPPYDETQVYVKRVAILRDRYLKALHPGALAAAGVQ